jgi:hypothetical protein
MKKLLVIFLFASLLYSSLFAQSSDSVIINLSNSKLKALRSNNNLMYEKEFHNPKSFYADLDGDGINEYLIIDSTRLNNNPFFTIYVYNCADTFYLIDSVQSGALKPYIENSKEEKGNIIVTGNIDFMQFNTDSNNYFLPLNCWRLKDDNIFLVNDDIYDLYISNNSDIMAYLDDYYSSNSKNCASSGKVKAAVAAVYGNYLSAGEKSLASQFLKNYYFCSDALQFQEKLNDIMKGYIGEN